MLGKLIKYDIKLGKRSYLTMAAVLTFAAVLIRIITKIDNESVSSLAEIVVVMVLLVIMTVIITAGVVLVYQNFARTLFSNEGYLTLTLPVKRNRLIVSKLITSLLWFNFMLLVAYIIMFIMIEGESGLDMLFKRIWTDMLIFIVMLIIVNLFAANGILILFQFAAAANISIGGKRLGWIFGAVCSGLFVLLEALFCVKTALPISNGTALWILRGDENTGNRLTLSIFHLHDITNYAMSLDIAFIITAFLFSAVAYIVIMLCIKKFVDLQ